jgi:type II secretory pathway pseudopilin PulG
LASASSLSAASACTIPAAQVLNSAHAAGVGGLVIPQASSITCSQTPPPPEPPFNGTPPLLFRGPAGCFSPPCFNGNVLMTQQTGPLVVTPVFWNPPGHPMSPVYKEIITRYLLDVALASGQDTNVYSVSNEYSGVNGQIHYNIRLGFPINDRDPLPASGCTLEAVDNSGIYADGSGYNACLDDGQLQAEINSVTAARGLPHNFSNMYVLFLPKAVESCFFAGATNTNQNACTINHLPSAAYCAYHNNSASNAVYANMVYPIYESPVGFTCGTDARFPVIESPNHNPDADVEISPTSHEINEAITDPDGETGWGDSSGNENGDDCAYIFGATNGKAGGLYNQTIIGQHFITQQEFSNRVFFASGGKAACVDSQRAEF